MRIAILSFFSGVNTRGVERWAKELSEKISDEFEIKIFSYGGNLPNFGQDDLSIFRRLFINKRSRIVAKFTLKLLPILMKNNYDIILPTDGGWEPALIRILAWITRKKMVIVGHSGKGWDDRNNLWCFPDSFVALSKPSEKWARSVNPFVRIDRISDAVDTQIFRPEGKRVELNLAKPVILSVASPDPGKRLDLAIRAVSKLDRGSLLVLGIGEKDKYFQLGKKILGKRFFAKKVSFDMVPEYYRAADIFTLPSWDREAFGMVYLEAMASGIPVVATDDELRREIIGGAGILVNPKDIDLYSKALEKALAISWGDKPRRQAEKFSWEKVARKYDSLFRDLVS